MTEHFRELQHAESLIDLRRYAEAEERVRGVLAIDPEHVVALMTLARALNEQAMNEEAEQAVRAALAHAPGDARCYAVLTDILIDIGDGSAAVTAAERGLSAAPHDFTSHYQYARALLTSRGRPRRRRLRRAHDAAVRAARLAPTSADAHNLVGMCLLSMGKHRRAQSSFRLALALEPHHTLAQNNLGVSEMDLGRFGAATSTWRAAAALDPHEKVLRQNLDNVLFVIGRRLVLGAALACVVLSMQTAPHEAGWPRAVTGLTLAVGISVVAWPFRHSFPRGFLRPSRVWRDTGIRGAALAVLLAAMMTFATYFSLAPQDSVSTAARVLGARPATLGYILLALMTTFALTTPRSGR